MLGIVTISIEPELRWGMHDTAKYDHLSAPLNKETQILQRLLDPLEDYKLPITFDINERCFYTDPFRGNR